MSRPELSVHSPTPAIEVVLVRPEIPPNVGNVARTCAAFGLPLHLVAAHGLHLDAAAVRRAGVDSWSQLELHWHDRLAEVAELTGGRLLAFTTGGRTELWDQVFRHGDLLVFGRESSGLSDADLAGCQVETVRIPQSAAVRSLNLATAVGMGCYAALAALRRGAGELSSPR